MFIKSTAAPRLLLHHPHYKLKGCNGKLLTSDHETKRNVPLLCASRQLFHGWIQRGVAQDLLTEFYNASHLALLWQYESPRSAFSKQLNYCHHEERGRAIVSKITDGIIQCCAQGKFETGWICHQRKLVLVWIGLSPSRFISRLLNFKQTNKITMVKEIGK